MRILHIIPYMHPRAGGPPAVVENVVRELSKAGYQSEIISSSLFCNGEEGSLLERLNEVAPTSFVSSSLSSIRFGAQTRRRILESVQAADIIHVHTLWSPLNVIARQACARHRRPYVVMPHGMLDPYSLGVKRWRKTIYLQMIERKNIQCAQRIIYTAAEEARLAQIGFGRLPRGTVIPLGADAPW